MRFIVPRLAAPYATNATSNAAAIMPGRCVALLCMLPKPTLSHKACLVNYQAGTFNAKICRFAYQKGEGLPSSQNAQWMLCLLAIARALKQDSRPKTPHQYANSSQISHRPRPKARHPHAKQPQVMIRQQSRQRVSR